MKIIGFVVRSFCRSFIYDMWNNERFKTISFVVL